MVIDAAAIFIGAVAAISGAGLASAAPQFAREMEAYAERLGALRIVLVPPFVPKARAFAYLFWLARMGGVFIALVGALFVASGLRNGQHR